MTQELSALEETVGFCKAVAILRNQLGDDYFQQLPFPRQLELFAGGDGETKMRMFKIFLDAKTLGFADWHNIVQATKGAGIFHDKAAEQMVGLATEFRHWHCIFKCTSRNCPYEGQAASEMARTASSFDDWRQVYDETQDPKYAHHQRQALENMQKLGTFADWYRTLRTTTNGTPLYKAAMEFIRGDEQPCEILLQVCAEHDIDSELFQLACEKLKSIN